MNLETNKRVLHIDLYRNHYRDRYIIGKLYFNDKYECDTFEPSYEESHPAIPVGSYKISLSVKSPKFQKKFPYATLCNGCPPRLLAVPGRDGILIHCGNGFNADGTLQTQGCILVGNNESVGAVHNSIITFQRLYNIMKEYEQVFIHIYDVPLDTQSIRYIRKKTNGV